jgi:hypothetical protein
MISDLANDHPDLRAAHADRREFSSAEAAEWPGIESSRNKTRLGRVPRAHAADVNRAVQGGYRSPTAIRKPSSSSPTH